MELCVVIVMFVLDWFHNVFDITWEYNEDITIF